MPKWDLDTWQIIGGLGIIAFVAVSAAIYYWSRSRCSECGRWSALVRDEAKTMPDKTVYGRYRCVFCGHRSWMDDTPVNDSQNRNFPDDNY